MADRADQTQADTGDAPSATDGGFTFTTEQARKWLLAEKARIENGIYERTEGDEAVTTNDPLLDTSGAAGTEADNADGMMEVDRTAASVAIERDTLDLINAALQRIEDGAYGVCVRDGAQIEPRRLAAIPYTPYCAKDAAIVEREASGQ